MVAPQYIDISAFQPANIDWVAYRNWSAQWDGISRVAMRSTYGTGFVDANFLPNQHGEGYRAGALAAGIDVIIYYHYAYPSLNSGQAEADYQRLIVGPIRPNDVLMLDYEEGTSQANAQWALDWLTRQEQNYGRLPTIYASRTYVLNRLQDARLTRYPLTMADWTLFPDMRPPCPAPWTFYTYLQFHDGLPNVPGIPGGVPVDANVYLGGSMTNSKGEVADFPDVSQMEPNESEFACGFFAVGECLFAGKAGGGPRGTGEQVDQWVDTHGGLTTGGVSIPDMINLFQQAALPFQLLPAINPTSSQSNDILLIKAAINSGYPVIVTIPEADVWDVDLGGNPYAPNWTPSGNHVINITGWNDNYLGTRVFLSHDTAAINGGIFGKVASQPRHYLQSSLHISWATIVQIPWLGGNTMGVPTGWHDDGVTLTAPNGNKFVAGFRAHVLAHSPQWSGGDLPLENEHHVPVFEYSNPTWNPGGGQQQISHEHMLAYTPTAGVGEEVMGGELFYYRSKADDLAVQITTLEASLMKETNQVIADEAEIAALKAAGGSISPEEQTAINNAVAALQALQQFIK
jgi:GH25 family lysozyme M1 (1,4-beta-N-acetylmuramidase)